jgi:hypothetical protein
MIAAELGIDQAKEPRAVRATRRGVTKVGLAKPALAAAGARGEKRGYKQGFGQGEMYREDKESKAAEKASVREFKKSKRLPLTELRTGKSSGQKGPGDLPKDY